MTIRKTIQAQVARLGLTAYAIAHAAKVDGEFTVSVNHVQEYLAGRKDMTSGKLDAILKVLGLKITKAITTRVVSAPAAPSSLSVRVPVQG